MRKRYYLLFPLLAFFSFTCKKNTGNSQPGKTFYNWDRFSMGVDLSYVNQVEDYGGRYRDSAEVRDLFRILKDHGANTVRVRLWHTPEWVAALNNGKMYYDLAGTEKTIRRAKEQGMAVNLNIHYSDRWADPAHQETPAAWKDLALPALKDSVYRYTLSVLDHLKSKNLVPEMVQVGNETNSGMLWPLGKVVNNNWQSFADLLNSGIRAVRDFSQTSSVKPRIILHVAQLQNATGWIQNLINHGVTDFDILGLSHYSKWSALKTMDEVENKIRTLKTDYKKQVMIVETAYPWTGDNGDNYTNILSVSDMAQGYDISPQEQLRYMKDLTQAVIRGGGTGLMYWEPAWISSRLNDGWGTGSSWENNAFFDFAGNTLPVINYMNHRYQF
jgi:arabinogalactan endo-1,4-beta-galactosidase